MSPAQLVPFPLLADPDGYWPTTIPYTKDARAACGTPGSSGAVVGCLSNDASDREHLPSLHDWIEVFRHSIPTFKAAALTDTSIPDQEARQAAADQWAKDFGSILDQLAKDPQAEIPGHRAQPLNCLTLCDVREQSLHDVGFKDIFKSLKDEANAEALQLLPEVLADLDALTCDRDRWMRALRGVFAGNIFDMGAAASAKHVTENAGHGLFTGALEALVPRPWAVDDADAMLDKLAPLQSKQQDGGGDPEQHQEQPSGQSVHRAYQKAVMFVDNAGADVVLGMLPLARELLKQGTKVIIAANEGPTINDITAEELKPVVQAAADVDDVIRDAVAAGQLTVMSSGNHLPVIDLRQVDAELASAVQDCDLVVLEGMGRAIETNLHADFRCDSWKLGMIKHPEVAQCLLGRMYDCVCKYSRST